jgi:hypothetical protein
MSKFMLLVALVLALVAGFAGVVQAQLPSPSPLPLPSATAETPWDVEVGPYKTYKEAYDSGQDLISKPSNNYLYCYVTTRPDGSIWLRLKNK